MNRARFLDFLPAAGLSLLAVCTPLLALAEPVDGPQVAAIFPPGWEPADIMRAAAEADAGVVRFGAMDNIGILEVSGEDGLSRLRAAGAWFTLHPQALGGCLLGAPMPAAAFTSYPPPNGVRPS